MSNKTVSNNKFDSLINERLSNTEREIMHSSIIDNGSLNEYIESCAHAFADLDSNYAELLLGENLDKEVEECKDLFSDNNDFITQLGIGSFAAVGMTNAAGLFNNPSIHMVAQSGEDKIFSDDLDRITYPTDSIVNNVELLTNSGNIGMESNAIQQQYSDTCAIKSQQLILNDFGINVTEDQLVQYSVDKGWYDGNGTQLEDVGNLLTDFGVPISQISDANVYTLVGELAQGHKIIVGVDSGELWNRGILSSAKDLFIGDTPNHALIVSGIDTTDPDNVKILITDPGTGDLCKEYPLDEFVDAWQDSNCFMVATQQPAPLEYNPEMINFDYALGNIPDMDFFIDNQSMEDSPQLLTELHSDILVADFILSDSDQIEITLDDFDSDNIVDDDFDNSDMLI